MSLKKKLIRLAHNRPDLRSDLLPILKEASFPNLKSRWGRKLSDWEDAPEIKKADVMEHNLYFSELPFYFGRKVDQLYYTKKEDRFWEPPTPITSFRKDANPPQYFLIEIDRQVYLVDTQGYNYARYIIWVPGDLADYFL